MLELSKTAKEQLDRYFVDQAISPIRICMISGCGGARLDLVLDEQKDSDIVHELDGYKFLIETALMEELQPGMVEFDPCFGFSITSNLKVDPSAGCGSCSLCGV